MKLTLLILIFSLTGRDVIDMVRSKNSPKSGVVHIKMILINKEGKMREREFITWSKKEGDVSKSITKVLSPSEVKGKGFLWLKKGEDVTQYIYLPEMKKMRRIGVQERRDSFLGSDLSYEDFRPRPIDEDIHNLLKEEECDGNICYVVESIPKDPESSVYGKVVSWIRKDILIPIKGEFYNKKGEFYKVMRAVKIEKIGDYWVAKKTEVEDLSKKHKTIMELIDVKFDLPIQDTTFTEAFFGR